MTVAPAAQTPTPGDLNCKVDDPLNSDSFHNRFIVWHGPTTGPVKKIALLMGNDYGTVSSGDLLKPLKRARLDARYMYDILLAKGFQSVCILDVNSADMYSAINEFTGEVTAQRNTNHDQDLLSLIYFAGHGGEDASDDPRIVPDDFKDLSNTSSTVKTVDVFDLLSYLPNSLIDSPPVVIVDACRNQIPTLHSYDNSISTRIVGAAPPYDLIFTSWHDETAGDGTFVDSLQNLLNKESWNYVLSPVLGDVVNDVKSVPPLQKSKQTPVGPISARAFDRYLWEPSDPTSEDEFMWEYGVSESMERRKQKVIACALLENIKAGLNSNEYRKSSWASDGLNAVSRYQNKICIGQVALRKSTSLIVRDRTAPALEKRFTITRSPENSSIRALLVNDIYWKSRGVREVAVGTVGDIVINQTMTTERQTHSDSLAERGLGICGPETAVGGAARSGVFVQWLPKYWPVNPANIVIQMSPDGTVSETQRTILGDLILQEKAHNPRQFYLRLVSTDCDSAISSHAIISATELEASVAEQLGLRLDESDNRFTLWTDWMSRHACLVRGVSGLCILIGFNNDSGVIRDAR